MRLSGWRSAAPAREAVSPRVMAVVEPVMATLGCEADPECWVAWGDEPTTRWTVMAPTRAGLVSVSVRVNVPQEGPRASGKLVRWSRVQVGDFAVEMQGDHHFASATLEGAILRGIDADADRIGAFLQGVFASIDGRPAPGAGRSAVPGRGRSAPG